MEFVQFAYKIYLHTLQTLNRISHWDKVEIYPHLSDKALRHEMNYVLGTAPRAQKYKCCVLSRETSHTDEKCTDGRVSLITVYTACPEGMFLFHYYNNTGCSGHSEQLTSP